MWNQRRPGFAVEASLLPELPELERRELARCTRSELESVPAHEFPQVVEAAPHLATPYNPERAFGQELELLRAGIGAQRRRLRR